MESGEDGIYNLISEGGKGAYLVPHISITEQDLAEIPGLRQLCYEISRLEAVAAHASGQTKYALKKMIIEMRRDQYVLKMAAKPPINVLSATRNWRHLEFYDDITIENELPVNRGLLSFFDPKHISFLLCNYSTLRQEGAEDFAADGWYIIEDLDRLIDKTLAEAYPLYYTIVIDKIDGENNKWIAEHLFQLYDTTYSPQYISTLWRHSIPFLLAQQAQRDYLVYHYTFVERGHWKQCARCEEIKLAHPFFFGINRRAVDGYNAVCKECRSKERQLQKEIKEIRAQREGTK